MSWIWAELLLAAIGLGFGFIKGAEQGGAFMAIGLALGAAGLFAMGGEGLWQGSEFLRTGVFADHSLFALFGWAGQTGWIGLDFLLTKVWEASMAYVWGGLIGLGLFITWLGEEVFN